MYFRTSSTPLIFLTILNFFFIFCLISLFQFSNELESIENMNLSALAVNRQGAEIMFCEIALPSFQFFEYNAGSSSIRKKKVDEKTEKKDRKVGRTYDK